MIEALVSVIIPTYRRPLDIIERALTSVVNQSYKNIEIIIVDDNGDESRSKPVESLINRYSCIADIIYLRHETNMGACKARNTGIQHSKGEYCAFLDDDDEWYQDKIKLQVQKAVTEDAGMVYCGICNVNTTTGKKIIKRAVLKDNPFREILMYNYIDTNSCVLIKKECFEKCGTYDEKLESSQDIDMYIRIVKKYKIACIEQPLVNYYIHEGIRITNNFRYRLESIPYITEKYKAEINNDKEILSVRNARYFLALIKNSIYLPAVKYMIRCFFRGEFNLFYIGKFLLKNRLDAVIKKQSKS